MGQLKIWMASRFSDQVALRANGIFGLRKTPALVAEIFMFESVNTWTDARTDGRTPARLVYYKLTL